MKWIRDLDLSQLQNWMIENNYPKYRAGQLYGWLWKREVDDFQQMRNLPLEMREKLAGEFCLERLETIDSRQSEDGCVKFALRLHDGNIVEMVLIPAPNRVTLCLSSQVGCALHCSFCATAHLGFTRNLSAYEIYGQALMADRLSRELYGMPLGNIVCMGMGEPLLNYDNILKALRMITSPDGMGWSPSRITLSTAGICDGIRRLAEEGFPIHLAVSLHTAVADQRGELMPVARKYPLQDLSDALAFYHERTGERVTIEYLLLRDVNDRREHVEALLKFCKRFPVKINIIEYNEHPFSPFRASSDAVRDGFIRALEARNLVVNLRHSKGKEIAAACGQLACLKREGRQI